MIPKYCAGNLISLNILLLNDTSAPNIPEKMAPNSIKFFILLDLKILLIEFFNSFNSVPILTFFFSFNVSTSSNFTDITTEIIFIIKQNIIGKYPFIANIKPDSTEVIASM